MAKKSSKLQSAFREVYSDEPSTVTRANVSGERKRKMMAAIAFSKARKAGAKLPKKGNSHNQSHSGKLGYYDVFSKDMSSGMKNMPRKHEQRRIEKESSYGDVMGMGGMTDKPSRVRKGI